MKNQWILRIHLKDCFLLLLNFFSCGHGGIRRSHVEIEFGKNFKAKHVHAH